MKMDIATSLGPVCFWGSLTGRPVLRVVTGAFAEEDLLSHGLTAYPPD